MSERPLIHCDSISKKFCRDLKKSLWYGVKDSWADLTVRGTQSNEVRDGEFWANKDISFELNRGECLGVIGRNGAGKTTLLKMLNGLIKPDSGRVRMRGQVGAMIALGAGFNPVLTGRENIYVNGSILGLSKSAIRDRMDEIVDFAELDEFIDAPVRSYSSGMSVRLGFAVAAVLVNPDVLILDEVLAVGDRAFRIRCMEKISELLTNSAVIFVSHQMSQISKTCTRAMLLNRGEVVLSGTPLEAIAAYESATTVAADPEFFTADGFQMKSCSLDQTSVDFGGSLTFTLEFTAPQPTDDSLLRVHVVDEAGDSLMEWDSRNHDQPINIVPGENRVSAQLDGLRLSKGNYFLAFALNHSDGVKYLIAGSRCCPFKSTTDHYGVCRAQL